MIYLDNIIFEIQNAGGISVYWSELIKRYGEKKVFFYGRPGLNIFSNLDRCFLRYERYPKFLSRRYLPFWPNKDELSSDKYIFHSSYFRYSNDSSAINVTTVHDFTYEHYISGLRKWVHSWQKKTAIKKSSGIICVSENTKRDLLRFHPWVDESKVRVIHNGVSELFEPVVGVSDRLYERLGFRSNRPYLLFVGDRSPYKNFDKFIELGFQLDEYDLVVVGGKPISDVENKKISTIKNRFYHFRGVTTEVLNLLYNGAFCLVYPSSYEGFGIPVLEAMRAGCPVVSTNLSSIPEVAGDAALLVDEVCVDKLAEKIRQLESPNLRDDIIQKGFNQAGKFSWDKCFAETYAFYQELLEKE
jgi:mannosyltransferase